MALFAFSSSFLLIIFFCDYDNDLMRYYCHTIYLKGFNFKHVCLLHVGTYETEIVIGILKMIKKTWP